MSGPWIVLGVRPSRLEAMTRNRDYWRSAYEGLVKQTGRDLYDGLGRDPRSQKPNAPA